MQATRRKLLGLAASCSLGLVVGLAGCGGGGGGSTLPVIASVADSVATTPTTLTFSGGTAVIKAKVTAPMGVGAGAVTVDLLNAGGTSVLIGGPKAMKLVSGTTDTYITSAPVAVPGNASAAAAPLSAKVSATDLTGQAATPVVVGTITVPPPPPPPGGP